MSILSEIFGSRNVIAESPPDVNDGIKTGNESGSGGTAQQRGHAGVKGGASASTPASRSTHTESAEEAEVNKQDAKKSGGSGGSGGSSGGREGSGGSGIEAKLKDCVTSKEVNPAKKQYSDCVSNGKGDCTEELVNLAQRITKCAAPDKFDSQK
ncbi:hypothetical protein DIS24_g5819 [Lasiodiplodia hormozganensis]|uniref:Uncharacterized protein n=1 Tax=Lasiodiplodia hormozganensis TaxID=869390 RepID=A0AA40CYF8_9PEZI|nr:hypothetical protein DIS24_g5819 [Lasiodiplodia hormozganensis]